MAAVADVVSTILVRILGDAKGLTTALTTADQGLGGTVKKIAGGLILLGGVKAGFDALGDANKEADRLGDATSRLNLQLGDLAGPLESTADGFAKIGASKQDMLELEANFADLATKAGIADPLIAANAADVAAIANAVSLLGDQDPATVVDEIGKAAGGAAKPLGELGVNLDPLAVQAQALADTGKSSAASLTANELAAARLKLILEQLQPKLTDVTTGTQDLEGEQRSLQARVETLSGSLGEKLAPAEASVLQFLNDEIDAIPSAIQGYQMLGKAIEDMARDALTPVARLADAVNAVIDAAGGLAGATTGSRSRVGGSPGNGLGAPRSESRTVADTIDFDERNGGARTVNNRIGGP